MPATSPRPKFDIVPWNPSFATQIAIIDEQHRQLVKLINDLAHAYVYGEKVGEVERVLEALIDYAAYHFATEEALWAEVLTKDTELARHLKTHNGFVGKVRAMQAKLDVGERRKVIDDLLSFLTGWLAHHILYEDKLFSLIYLQVKEGVNLEAAKSQAKEVMTGQTSGLIESVLTMYKDLSSRTLALEREAYLRQLAEQALLEQEQHWQSVLGASSDNLWDWTLTSEDLNPNSQLLTKDKFSQKGLSIHPDDWPGLWQDFFNHLMGQTEVFIHQYRVLDANHQERWIQARGKVIELDSLNRPKRIVGTQTDITERKTTEQTLERERDVRTLIGDFAADFIASSIENFDAAINRALKASGEYLRSDRTYIFLLSADGLRLSNTHEWCAAGITPEIDNLQSIPSSALPWWWSQFRDVGYVLVPRVKDMPPEANNEYQILDAQGIFSACVYPLYIGKELVGFIGSDSVTHECHWGTEIIEFLSLIANLLGIALGHQRLHQTRTQAIYQLERAEELAHLGHWYIGYASTKVSWSKEMFRIFEQDSATFIPSLASYLELIHPDDRTLIFNTYKEAKASLSDLYLEHRILLKGKKIKHLEVRGQFEIDQEGQLVRADGTVQDVTEKVQYRETLQRLAFSDPLTGLPNRRSAEASLLAEMKYCEKQGLRLVVFLLDLDNFGEINERHGAAVGDTLLKILAERIRLLFNDTVVIARVGGDEFGGLFTKLQPEATYYQHIKRLLGVISKPIEIDGISLVLTASIGITEYPQPVLVAGEQLIRQAQQALFQAKMLGKGRFYKYDIDSEQSARKLIDNQDQVRKALGAGEFVLYYQPKVNMSSGVVFGVEALIRWQKTSGELIAPNNFLPALYNHPLEVELGDWVIRTALAQMRVWQQQGLAIQVSVNVSSMQLFDESFVEKLKYLLNDYSDLPASALQLEVLESCMLKDLDAVSNVMQRSHELGVSFALDDFGTGYSSLAYLKHLPARVLKIDQTFVQEMTKNTDDLSIISGVVGMANAFGMQVIAEGVESIEQGNLLLRLGCEQGQGYGIARPMPAKDVLAWVQGWQVDPSWLGRKPVGVQNLALIYAEVEHRRWVMEVEDWLKGKTETIPILNHQECKLGLWIASEEKGHFGLHSRFFNLAELHRNVHLLVIKAIALRNKGEVEKAQLLLPQILQERDLFLEELRELIG